MSAPDLAAGPAPSGSAGPAGSRVAVVGQVARDLVLRVAGLPDPGGSVPVVERREVLGGKGANQAVGLAQLGVPVALVAVSGEDAVGADVLEQAARDAIDVSDVVRRGTTALLVDVVDAPGSRRLLEDVPSDALLTPADVQSAAGLLRSAGTVVLQLQQPVDALLAVLDVVDPAARVVLDGAVRDERARAALLARAQVVRADAQETELLLGRPIPGLEATRAAADELLQRGPELVALAVPDEGDLVAWHGGQVVLPLSEDAVDPTGGGDSFVAGLVAALVAGAPRERAAQVAATCARSTVARLGGRPALDRSVLA